MAIKNFGKGTVKFNEGIIVSGSSPQLYVSGNMTTSGNISVDGDVYTDKIRRASDSGTTTKILLDDEVVKIYAGHASDNICTINATGLTVAGTTHLSSSAGTEVLRIAKADGDTREIVLENDGVDAASIYMNSAEHLFIRQENASNDLCLRIAAINAIRIDGSTSRVGIFTDTPGRKLDILDALDPQLRLTQTDGSNYVDFKATVAGDLEITGSATNAHLKFISPGNASIIIQSDAADGDAQIGFSVDAGASLIFSVGVDDGDSDKFKIGTSTVDTNTRLTIDANGNVGIGTSGPKVPLDVHIPAGFIAALPDDIGGGHVAAWGTEDTSDTLAAGKLMYMATDGKWKYADADAVATSGGVLLGIALGTAVSDGILLKGYFDAATIQGSFVKGGACYVSETVGVIDFTAPSVAGDVVRVVGYGTDTANVIYFDPSSTWIEL